MKNIKRIILILSILCLSMFTLAACDPLKNFSLEGYIDVVYNAMGGTMDYLPTRTLKVLPNSLLPDPIGNASGYGTNLQPAKKVGFSIEGWYTKIIKENYILDTEGSYVDYFEFTKTVDGDYVGTPIYVQTQEGIFVAKKAADFEENATVIYEIYDAEIDKHHINIEGIEVDTEYTPELYLFSDESNPKLLKYNFYYIYEPYNTENPEHVAKDRFNAEAKYVVYDSINPNHTELVRYEADFEFDENSKWSFSKDRIGSDTITLYAKWKKLYRIIWDYGTGSSSESTSAGTYTVEPGHTITSTSYIPQKEGFTFLEWTKEDGTKWDFEKDIFPEEVGVNSITLHAKYIEGNYERITNKQGLENCLKDSASLSKNFLLICDVDFGGAKINPLGLQSGNEALPFKGIFNGNGHTIKNFIVDATNISLKVIDPKYGYFALFNTIENATIQNLNVEYTIKVTDDSRGDVRIGGLVGAASGSNIIRNCNLTVNMTSLKSTSPIQYGNVIGYYHEGATAVISLTNANITTEFNDSKKVTFTTEIISND